MHLIEATAVRLQAIQPWRMFSLDAHEAATGAHGLAVGLVWWGCAMALAIGYFTVLFRSLRGKVADADERRRWRTSRRVSVGRLWSRSSLTYRVIGYVAGPIGNRSDDLYSVSVH